MQLSAADKAVGVHRYSKLRSKSKRAGGWMQCGVRACCVSRRNTRNRVGSAPPALYSAFQNMQLRGQGEGGQKGGDFCGTGCAAVASGKAQQRIVRG